MNQNTAQHLAVTPLFVERDVQLVAGDALRLQQTFAEAYGGRSMRIARYARIVLFRLPCEGIWAIGLPPAVADSDGALARAGLRDILQMIQRIGDDFIFVLKHLPGIVQILPRVIDRHTFER